MTDTDVRTIRELIEEQAAGRSELAKGAYEAGKRAAHLPD